MSNDERIAILETTIHHIDGAMSDIKNEIRSMGNRLENSISELRFEVRSEIKSVNDRMDNMNERINDRLWKITFWLASFITAAFSGLLYTMAKGFNWL